MNTAPLGHVFPPIRDPHALPRRVLVLAAHPDDEVIGIGGLLAFHGERGDHVRIVHATGGDAGDPEGRHAGAPGGIAALREQELQRALAALGLGAGENFGLPDGQLGAHAKELAQRVEELFASEAPELLYTFHAGEYHADHRVLAAAACAARAALPATTRVLLFGVNQTVPYGALYEYSARVAVKRRALGCFESQLAYLDFAAKVMHRDQAATVNVELPEITHAELLLEVSLASWPEHVRSSASALRDAAPELFEDDA